MEATQLCTMHLISAGGLHGKGFGGTVEHRLSDHLWADNCQAVFSKANVPDKKHVHVHVRPFYFSKFSYFLNGSLHAQCVLYGTCAQKNCYG